ncbi:GGDEF domain-containing protein [Sphingomonas segetis]|uniref:GGDEF domain-containing protein n=1 Tax=Sphingomonas segetis TaxID=1104779 RepID=UPI0012D358A6|nr:GGDEF domain-containing protein [Sphingomonas segetis]
MSEQVMDVSDVGQLVSEISALRARVAQLQERVEQLDLLAHEDSLVDLPNRRGFVRALERLIDRVSRYQEKAALLFVDLDGLKLINDSFGHQAGDAALIQVARLLVGGVRKSDVVARIGGDEFAILLGHSDEESARETAARLVDVIADSDFTHDGQVLPLSVAIGAALIEADDSPESAMARADHEMYRRKAA